jgi:hypothetical protein
MDHIWSLKELLAFRFVLNKLRTRHFISGSVAKKIFLQFDSIIFTFMCHFSPNEND